MKPSSGIDANRWLEKCIDAIALASVDQNTREILYTALGVFSGVIYEPELTHLKHLCNICQMEMCLNQRMVDHHTHRGDDATSDNT